MNAAATIRTERLSTHFALTGPRFKSKVKEKFDGRHENHVFILRMKEKIRMDVESNVEQFSATCSPYHNRMCILTTETSR